MQRIHVDRPWARDRECLGGDDATWLFAIRRVGACPGGEYARRAASEAGRTSDLVYVLIPATNVVSQETARGR